MIDFFQKHPLIEPKTFLGDAAFDTIKIYKSLFEEIGFQKAFIPLKTKLSVEGIVVLCQEKVQIKYALFSVELPC